MEPPFRLFNASRIVNNLMVKIGSSEWIDAIVSVEMSSIVSSQLNQPYHEEALDIFMEFLFMKSLNQFIVMFL